MLKEIRKTNAGVEYWDTEAKKVIIGGVDLAKGEDKTVIDGKVVDTQTDINLDEMNDEQLLDFAKQNGIGVPGKMKKEETIRNYIVGELNAVVDSE